MYFRINGALLWARGANVVPMDQLEGRLTEEAHVLLVESAANVNMNMLQVWGGGMILSDSSYDACDERGILLYLDMMFVDQNLHPASLNNEIKEEIRFIIRCLSSHPSIVLRNGCNEVSVKIFTHLTI